MNYFNILHHCIDRLLIYSTYIKLVERSIQNADMVHSK
jgi:hypothetical protein